MSIKKELLEELTKEQLESIAESKGIKFDKLSIAQQKYYENWEEKEKIVDLMNENCDISVKEIEDFLKLEK